MKCPWNNIKEHDKMCEFKGETGVCSLGPETVFPGSPSVCTFFILH